MDQIRAGASNLMLSRFGFGAMGIGSTAWRPWVREEKDSTELLRRSLELGITFFDTSNYYSLGESERILGRCLADLTTREEVIIATKVGNQMGDGPNTGGYSKKNILAAAEASRDRLGVEYIDLYQTHIWRPGSRVEEILEAFDELIERGVVRYTGVTDLPAWLTAKFVYRAKELGLRGISTVQYHYNLVWRGMERELLPFCAAEGIGTILYSPLARGYLASSSGHSRNTVRAKTDTFAKKWYGREQDDAVHESLLRVAELRRTAPAVAALAWVAQRNPDSNILIGATDVAQLDVIEAAASLSLEPAEMAELEDGYQPRMTYDH